jgi:hypothetical protein
MLRAAYGSKDWEIYERSGFEAELPRVAEKK